MSKVLRLYNSFTRSINEVKLNDKLVGVGGKGEPTIGSFYICGPTVYSNSHLGHAITYTRADLFRRFMKSIFNVKLTTVMNITDIDDKILAKAQEIATPKLGTDTDNESNKEQVFNLSSDPSKHLFRHVSERFHKSFLDDMAFIRVKPPDISIKVSQQMNLLVNYIQKLEEAGHAYIAPNGDIYFKVVSIPNYVGRTDERNAIESSNSGPDIKQDVRDFVLWKAAKPNEPIWRYKSLVTGQEVPGRPGWHVQCSAIASAIFGNKLDFHFGGKDLIFPHHYNEQACCCAYHHLDTSKDFHVWTENWLHSGHLVLHEEKMSKSLGNVLGIKDFINDTSVNALRLLCIGSHYRADVNFNDDLLESMRSLDHKLGAFSNYLSDELRHLSESSLLEDGGSSPIVDFGYHICQAHEEMLEGICDDFDLHRGLQAILDLSKRVYNVGISQIEPQALVSIWKLLSDWCETCGLVYGPMNENHDENLVNIVRDFRQSVRRLAVDELKRIKQNGSESEQSRVLLKSLLDSCDLVRLRMDESGYVIRDKKT